MLKRLIAAACASADDRRGRGAPKPTDLTGAGATFPAPVYAKWARGLRGQTGIGLNYQAIGSGGGIKQIKAKTVDFGASDKPLKPEDLDAAGLFQFPTVIGGVVPVMNLPGIKPGQIKLTGAVLADIYLGEINKWNDPQIAALNPGVPLPEPADHRRPPFGRLGHQLPLHHLPGDEEPDLGVQGRRQRLGAMADRPRRQGQRRRRRLRASRPSASIGYVEYAYAKQNHMTYALMQNQAGHVRRRRTPTTSPPPPAMATGRRPRASICCCSTSRAPPPGRSPAPPSSWSTSSRPTPRRGAEVLKFFDWAYKNGDAGRGGARLCAAARRR